MPAPPTQVYATDRNGTIRVLDPTTLAPVGSTWTSSAYKTQPGPALFGLAFDSSSYNLYTVGLPNGTNSSFYALAPGLVGAQNTLVPAAPPASMPQDPDPLPGAATLPQVGFQPDYVAVDSANKRVFVADTMRFLTAWSTDLAGNDGVFTQLPGSPYHPSSGVIRAQGVAYDSTHNRVYVLCQNSQGQDQLAVYDASTAPMTQVTGSPFTFVTSLNLAGSHGSIVYDAANHHILITSSVGLTVLNDTAPYAAVAGSPFLTGGLDPRGLAIDSTHGRVYISNFGSDNLAVLSLSTFAAVSGSPYATGHGPRSVAYSSNKVYVANFNSNPGGITVFDASAVPLTSVSGSPFQSALSFSKLVIGP